MSSTDIDHRPAKKRRFFLEDENELEQNDLGQPENADASQLHVQLHVTNRAGTADTTTSPIENKDPEPEEQGIIRNDSTKYGGFNVELFSSVVGCPVPEETIQKLRRLAGDNMDRAINIYLDGSWETNAHQEPDTRIPDAHSETNTIPTEPHSSSQPTAHLEPNDHVHDENVLENDPDWRYIGAFGVGGWATMSGTNLIKYGDHVNIKRNKVQPVAKVGRGGKPLRGPNAKPNIITRFTDANNYEIGRLPQETASWVSTLIDQDICAFEGVCVFAPDRIRVNDTIYIQLKCFLLKDAFQRTSTSGMEDDASSSRIFEQQETGEEKILRLRQVALVTLFDEINIAPTSINEMTARHKRKGLLQAAEIEEQQAKAGQPPAAKSSNDAGDSSDSEEGEKLDDDQLDTLYQKAQNFDFNMPEAVPDDNFNLELRKYQRQALHWMMGKEKDVKTDRLASMHPLWEEYSWPVKDVDDKDLPRVRGKDKFYVNPYSGELSLKFPVQEQNCLGGILADEMGLGKTIEMMSLIHSHKPNNDTGPASNLSWPSTSGLAFAPYTTLVVAPTSLLSQWESEALKASKPGSMKVLVYYGTDTSVNLRSLCSGNNQAAPNIVITSYGVLRSEHTRTAVTGKSGLFSVNYFRVILDEAHYIKNRASKTARACYGIEGRHRWVLTGTPIVNRLEDLYSLVRFLRVEPWCNFSFWKTFITVPFESKDFMRALNVMQTVLEPLVLRRTKNMKTPEGDALVPLPSRTITVEEVELSKQEREIYDIIFCRAKRAFNDNIAAGTLLKSYTTIFAQLLRLRQTCCHPTLTRNQAIVAEEEDAAIATDKINLLKDDMDLQDLIDTFTASVQTTDGEERDPTANFTTHALRQIQTESSGECPICSEEPMINPSVTGCWHSACKDCLDSYIRHQKDKGEVPKCFSCRDVLQTRDIFEVVRHNQPTLNDDEGAATTSGSNSPVPRISLRRLNPLSPSAHTSAKIHALIGHLTRLPPDAKCVVFSQFTSFLDLIAPQLTRAGITHLRFDGTMSQKARASVLTQFSDTDVFDQEDDEENDSISTPESRRRKQAKPNSAGGQSSPTVLLISLRAGGVGLNLTAANHVYMMDPWWSFAVEAQAIDRVHRMGQLKDVKVTRFVVKNSIEGRILRIQERKMMIAGSLGLRVGGDGGEEERRKERIEELKLLFE